MHNIREHVSPTDSPLVKNILAAVFGRALRGSTVGFRLLQRFSVGLAIKCISVSVLDLYVCIFDA